MSKRLLSRRSRQRERLHAMGLSICLLVCLSVCPFAKNAIFSKTKKFRTMVSIDDLGGDQGGDDQGGDDLGETT